MSIHIVAGFNSINHIKRSKYFKVNLGFVSTVEKNGNREYNKSDEFCYFYNKKYKTTIAGKGLIGDISFYLDYNIVNDILLLYYNDEYEEYVYKLDLTHIREKGIEDYLGFILKQTEEKHNAEIEKRKIKEEEVVVGNADKLFLNPGSVKYEDLMEYIRNKKNKSNK